jgi:uncharacterized oligopeptide transporter (OPT) family protein
MASNLSHLLQIVKEQLPFPSGTATAQLIAVLHDEPLPDTTALLRRRHGYEAVETDDSIPEPQAEDVMASEDQLAERQLVKSEGWLDLIWSFTASGILTVRASSSLV